MRAPFPMSAPPSAERTVHDGAIAYFRSFYVRKTLCFTVFTYIPPYQKPRVDVLWCHDQFLYRTIKIPSQEQQSLPIQHHLRF